MITENEYIPKVTDPGILRWASSPASARLCKLHNQGLHNKFREFRDCTLKLHNQGLHNAFRDCAFKTLFLSSVWLVDTQEFNLKCVPKFPFAYFESKAALKTNF